MSAQNSATIKAKFENGDKPQGSDYVDWIDSFVSKVDTTAQSVTSDLTAPKIIGSTEVSSPQVNATEVSASVGSFTRVTTGNLAVTGTVSASAMHVTNMTINGSANIPVLDGPVQVGPTGQRGRLMLVQQAEISGNNAKKTITLPGGSDIIDFKYIPRSPLSTSAASTVDILIGTSADDAKFARLTNVSGMHYRTMANDTDVSGLASVSGSPAVIIVGATAVSGAIASGGRGVVNIVYLQKQ